MKNNEWLGARKSLRHSFLMLVLMAFFCTVSLSHLQYSIVNIKIMAYQVIGIIFIVCFWSDVFIRSRSIPVSKQDVFPFIFLYLLMLFGAAISSIGAFLMLGSYTQFMKGFLEIAFINIFFISLFLFLGEHKYVDAKKFLLLLLFMAGLSCVYQFFAIYFTLSSGIDLDELVWPLISSWTPGAENRVIGLGTAITGFRHGGFSGSSNTLATMTICAVPIALYLLQSKTKWMFTLVLVLLFSLLAGMSRSGIVGMAVTLLAMVIIAGRPRFAQVIVVCAAIISIPLFILIVELWIEVDVISTFFDIVVYRLTNSSYQDSPRFEALLAGLDMIDRTPIFGSGINGSPVLMQEYPVFSVLGGSLHNYWVELFADAGLFAIPSVVYYFCLLLKSISLKNIYYKALFASLCGLIVNGCFHSSIEKPGIQAFIILLYMCAIAERERVNSKSDYLQSEHTGILSR